LNKILLTKGRFLFVENNCPYCAIAKKSTLKINNLLPLNKRIIIKDCTNLGKFGIYGDNIIKEYSDYLDGYPTLFLGMHKKVGASSIIEYTAWLKAKLRKELIIQQGNEYLPNINKYALFDLECKHKKGRLVCN